MVYCVMGRSLYVLLHDSLVRADLGAETATVADGGIDDDGFLADGNGRTARYADASLAENTVLRARPDLSRLMPAPLGLNRALLACQHHFDPRQGQCFLDDGGGFVKIEGIDDKKVFHSQSWDDLGDVQLAVAGTLERES